MLHLSREQARRALLSYHHLLPPRSCAAHGIGKIFSRLRAIQVDPLDVAGRNAYLVMQARIRAFQDEMLDAHLYGDRAAVEAWDKARSIVPMEDWWGLAPFREEFVERYRGVDNQSEELLRYVREEVRRRGQAGSLDLDDRGTVEGLPRTLYLAAELGRIVPETPAADPPREVSFLAPLDNILWDRGLIEDLFDFTYTWEVYKPAAIREYGYYVMPVLAGNEFVARWEPRRTDDALSVRGWWWEPPVTARRKDEDLLAAVGRALRAFAGYLGREKLEVEAGVTRADAAYLRKAFAS